ncbi:MAG: OmpA family protein [Clostridiales bacterium]|nr:OmpA family protein [Clostridiales bacterium]
MSRQRRGYRGPRGGDNGAHWISYSDMMASLLLVFVLAVVYSVYQYYSMLEIKTHQLNEQQLELDRATITLVQREEELEAANVTLMGKQEELAAIQIQLDQQESDLKAAQSALLTKEEEQALLQLQLAEQADKLAAMQTVLEAQKSEMLTQQKRIDDLIGVRTQIIEDLSEALNRSNLRATVDPATGDIVLDSAVFFDSNSSTIKDSGRELLSRFLPVYLSVLMQDEYVDFVGEIIIEGHTDTAGSYIVNLKLSQNRALSVAEYCLQLPSLSGNQRTLLQDLLTAKGRSYSDPVYNSDGSVNMDQSRRVEFKFRLKDSEMIEEMNRILSQMEE